MLSVLKLFKKIQKKVCETLINFSAILQRYTQLPPLDKTHLVVARGIIHQDASLKCINEENLTERRSYNRQVNRSPQL